MQRTIELDPELTEGWVLLGKVLAELGKLREAIEVQYEAVKLKHTDFDLSILKNIAANHDQKTPKHLDLGINIGWLSVHRALGTPKGVLKTIAPFFGYEWAYTSMDGMQAGMLYSRYLRSGEEPD